MKSSLLSSAKRLHWYHWFVIAASSTLTISAWYISSSQIEEKNVQRFEFEATHLLALVSERMSRYEDALRAGAAAVHSQNNYMDSRQWQLFADRLNLEESYPGINGIGVINFVKPEQLESFLQREQVLRPSFKIHPKHDKQAYWPITVIEPVALNAKAVGLDMAFESNRLTAAQKARDQGTTQITAPIILIQDARKTPGFLQFVPFFKNGSVDNTDQRQAQFIGHIYAPFIMQNLIEGMLEQDRRNLIFSIFDQQDELYNEIRSDNSDLDPAPLFKKQVTIQMYGRPWQFNIQAAQSFRDATSNIQPMFILAGGFIIDLILILLFLNFSGSRERAISLAQQMTNNLIISENYLRAIINTSPCGMIIVNEAGVIEKANPEIEKMFGYQEIDLIGKEIELLLPARFQKIHPHHRKDFHTNPTNRTMGIGSDVFGLNQQGHEFPAQIGLAHFVAQDGVKTVATVIDISEQVSTTNELKRSNKELSDFVYVASHDLKAPLRGIMQLSSWIEEDIADTANEETLQNLSLLGNRTSRLEKLLDDLSIYSRIGQNNRELKVVDLLEMFNMVFELSDPPKNIILHCDKPMPTFETLAIPLEVIIRNLLGNAIKHNNKPEGKIDISVSEHETLYEISILDNGPGIDARYHEQIFELFRTLRPRDEVEGSGMGLSIVKKLLDNHGGTIRVDSDGISGTCFTFTWLKRL